MLYYDFTVDNKVYKLILDTKSVIALEKALNCNPLGIFGNGDRIPTITEMVNILHAALQHYQHGLTVNDCYGIFDKYIADGHNATDFISDIVEIYRISGLIPKEEDLEEKN